jgi:hypothetical protein
VRRKPDLAGKTFFGWEVLARVGVPGQGNVSWDCRCRGCGVTHQVRTQYLVSGQSRCCRKCTKKLGYNNQITPLCRYEELQTEDEYFINALREFLGLQPLYAGSGRRTMPNHWKRKKAEREKGESMLSPEDDGWWGSSD